MDTPIHFQIWRLTLLFLAGIACHLTFRIYTAFRGVFNLGKVQRNLLDALLALGVTGCVGYVTLAANWGELRLYVPLAVGVGFLTCNLLIGPETYRGSFLLFTKVKIALGWVFLNTLAPLKRQTSSFFLQAKGWINPPSPPPSDDP